jgi:hypothetical protein
MYDLSRKILQCIFVDIHVVWITNYLKAIIQVNLYFKDSKALCSFIKEALDV